MSCPDCITGGLLPGEPTGSVSTQGAYFAQAPADAPEASSKRAIVLLTDAYGLELKNSKIIADNFARELRCDVWIPDYFNGRPLMPLNYFGLTPHRAGTPMTFFRWIKWVLFSIPLLPRFWTSRPSVVESRITKLVHTIKEEKGYEKLGVIGYCYGGATAVRISSKSLFHSVVICHPGWISMKEIKAISIPASWVCAEDDFTFKSTQRSKAEVVFAERKETSGFIEYEFVDYKGTAHGFASRPSLEFPEVKEGYENAFKQAVTWFAKTLVV